MHVTQDRARLLLTVPEAARELRAGTSTVWRWIQNGQLPVVKLGRSVRIRRADLEAFIEAHSITVGDEGA